MIDLVGHSPSGIGLANAAVLACFLDHLVSKEVLSRIEARHILGRAYTALAPHRDITPVQDAMEVVSKIARRFAEDAD